MVETINHKGKRILFFMNKYVKVFEQHLQAYKEDITAFKAHWQRIYEISAKEHEWKSIIHEKDLLLKELTQQQQIWDLAFMDHKMLKY